MNVRKTGDERYLPKDAYNSDITRDMDEKCR